MRIAFFKGLMFVLLLVSGVSIQSEPLEMSNLGIVNQFSKDRTNLSGLTAEQARQRLKADTDRIKAEIIAQLCIDANENQPCSVLPMDNTDFSEFFVYTFLTESGQNSFDVFSWQSFIALNWPLDAGSGQAANKLKMPDSYPRQWSSYKTRKEILGGVDGSEVCATQKVQAGRSSIVITQNFIQTNGQPLIDRDSNYVIYDVRVNKEMSDYIEANGLATKEGQQAFFASGKEIDFPKGRFDDVASKTGGQEGSIAIKTAWKILSDDAAQSGRFFTVDGLVAIESAVSSSGEAFCLETKLGMVGMHIMRRTESGNGDKWIWSTFEHVDNAPLAANYRRPNDGLHDQPFEGGCKAPDVVDREFTFYKEDCPDCETNQIADAEWRWSQQPPHAVDASNVVQSPTQVVRCWEIFEGTKLINDIWRDNLAGTIWANYESTSAQWVGSKPNDVQPNGEVPKFMSNTTLETYEQDKPSGSCIGCHAVSRTATGHDSNLLFLLNLKSRF